MKTYTIVVLKGDGIGPEVIDAALQVLEAVERREGSFRLDCHFYPAGAEYYRQTLAMASKIPFLRGLSPWILKDFRSPRRQHPIYQQGWNRKGLESETGTRKAAFDVLAEHYRAIEQRH